MTDYSQNTDFSALDALSTGDPAKIISGSDVDAEFAEISTAIASKIDKPSSPTAGDVLTYSGGAWAAAEPSAVPVGTVIMYAGSTEPTDWLYCDGRSLSQATYSGLYSVIGTDYGSSGGAGTFNLPDLRFRVAIGPDDMGTANGAANRDSGATIGLGDADTVGSAGGEASHTLSQAEMDHKHETWTGNNGAYVYDGATSTGRAYTMTGATSTSSDSRNSVFSGDNEAADTVSAHNTMPPFVVMNYIIRYQ